MEVAITQTAKSETGFYLTGVCGNVAATVAIHSDRVQVICQNAAHKVWRGAGRFFPSVDAAIAGYKSGEMKAIIRAAQVAA